MFNFVYMGKVMFVRVRLGLCIEKLFLFINELNSDPSQVTPFENEKRILLNSKKNMCYINKLEIIT